MRRRMIHLVRHNISMPSFSPPAIPKFGHRTAYEILAKWCGAINDGSLRLLILLTRVEGALMSQSSIDILASAWALLTEEVGFPVGYDGTATPEAHSAVETMQQLLRDHILATHDDRLFSLLHLLGQASMRMEKVLWPEQFERMTDEVESALRIANDPSTKWHSADEIPPEQPA